MSDKISDHLFNVIEEYRGKISDGKVYVYPDIPKRKLNNALNAYASSCDNEEVIALVDDTVFGRADNGFLITMGGIYGKELMSDVQFCDISSVKNISVCGLVNVDFKIDKVFKIKLTQPKKKSLKLIASMLEEIHSIYTDYIDARDSIDTKIKSEIQLENTLPSTVALSTSTNVLVLSLVLLTVSDGIINDNELELATAFIEEEESILDKKEALAFYHDNVEKLVSSYTKFGSLFQLQTNKLLAKIEYLNDEHEINNLEIMLNGMVEVSDEIHSQNTVDMMNKIMQKQNRILEKPLVETNKESKVKSDEMELLEMFEYSMDINVPAVNKINKSENTSGIMNKYWEKVEILAMPYLLEYAKKGLQDDESLKGIFSTIYELMPMPLRFVLSKDKFIQLCMDRREPILLKLNTYKTLG